MALLKIKPPQGVVKAFEEGLRTLLDGPDKGNSGTIVAQKYIGDSTIFPTQDDVGIPRGALPNRDASVYNPQQVFVLGLSDLAGNPATADAAAQFGWRLFAGTSKDKTVLGRVALRTAQPGPAIVGPVVMNGPGKLIARVVAQSQSQWKLTACFCGTRAWDTLQASLGMDSLSAVQTEDYELRLLTLPGMNLEVIWLAAQKQGSGDLVAALRTETTVPDLNFSPTITMAHFLSLVAPAAVPKMASLRRTP